MKSKRNIAIMFAISLLQGMVFYGPIATLYRQSAGITVFQITLIESISLALCLVLELPWGIIADKIGYKKTMVFCCSLYVISKIVFWRATDFTGFLIERIMLSIVISGLSGVTYSILYLSCSEKDSQKVFGIYNTLQTIGLLFASTIYSVFIGENYRLCGLLTIFSYTFAALLSLALEDVGKEKDHENAFPRGFFTLLKHYLSNKYLLLFLLSVALLSETHQTITVFLNQLQYVKSGLSNNFIGYIYVGVTIIGLLGAFSSTLTRKLGVLPFAILLYVGAIVACGTLAFTNNPWLSIIAISVLRLAFSLFEPLQMDLQNKLVVSPNRATELSIYAVFIESVGIGTNLIFGKLSDTNLSFAMTLGTVFCFLGLVMFLIWYKKSGGYFNDKKGINIRTTKA
jgi:MFS family permease